MKILSAQQIYEADKLTIERQQITSDALMERAAVGVFNWIHQRLQGNPVRIHIFSGIGNNGGDGLALARHLKEHDYSINVYVVNYSEKRSKDFLLNLDRLKERKLWPEFLDSNHHITEIGTDDIIVDAIFGIGLNRAPDEWVGHLIQHINKSSAFVLSIDIPSGMFMNQVPLNGESVVHANHVLSFQCPKLPFFLPDTASYLDQWEVLDIGLDDDYLQQVSADFELLVKPKVQSIYKPRHKFSHKGNYGHAVLIGGSYGKIGAIHLAARACLSAGVGLVTTYVPKCGYIPIQTGIPEAMVLTDDEEKLLSKIDLPFAPNVIGIGMGMGIAKDTIRAFGDFLKENEVPLVVDADGLNILALEPNLLKKLPKKTILTPHPKELERLLGPWKDDFEKLRKAKRFSLEYDCILVIKGAHTIVVYQGQGHINPTGNPGMATAGSGDVLAGMITALVAQNYDPLQASIFAVFIHGLAGDVSAFKSGYEAITALSIIENVGSAFLELFSKKSTVGEDSEVRP